MANAEKMTCEEIANALTKLTKRIEKLETFKKDTIEDINGIDTQLEELENFKIAAIDDINDIFDDLSEIERVLTGNTDD